ncbi:hypothetical protein FBU59_004636 [Linderina macrospora]|uniref:Uncharacterized protein n=1 Tax=Linderina macrospora TaxID=4868 RepID=A0ACC1J4V5_9FUNG|nr:hypothetical protein FBU59_004636 [Linderina macrospora]
MRTSSALTFTILATLAAAAPIDLESDSNSVVASTSAAEVTPTATSDISTPTQTENAEASLTPTEPGSGDSTDGANPPTDELFEGSRAVGSEDDVDDTVQQGGNGFGSSFDPSSVSTGLQPKVVEAIIGKLLNSAFVRSQGTYAKRSAIDDGEDDDLRYALARSLYDHANQRGGSISKLSRRLGPDLTIELIDTGLQSGINAAVNSHNQAIVKRDSRRSYVVPNYHEYY